MKGVKGVVIDGRCRDLAELRGLGLPVSARGRLLSSDLTCAAVRSL